MKSILENRSALAKEVDKVAEVAGLSLIHISEPTRP